MSCLANKQILVGITGGIAAYKSADLVRRLLEAGARVRVAMTRNATRFITPLTLQAVSGESVHVDLLDTEAESGMGHIDLARWADHVIIAPASANFLARLAHGMADDLLTTLCLATTADLFVAPAMNRQMWANPATQANLELLESRGIRSLGPGEGSQACGETGPGRMLEPTELVDAISQALGPGRLAGVRMVITAGPTVEAIDPVRAVTNHSSGKMGYAVAQAAVDAGAETTLISGPTHLAPPAGAHRICVTSALEMRAAAIDAIANCDVFCGVAAVADYRPADPGKQKMKKDADQIEIRMIKNPDIISEIAQHDSRPFTVGFAAETQELEKLAREKLVRKRLDMVIANRVGVPGVGFGSDDNAVIIIDRHGSRELAALPKSKLARVLIEEIADRYHAQNTKENTNTNPRQTHR
ncbi:MAG: bifunctional phosphopantothenoylcysteine decarboxylase/phosphopantothenate--cysteine ligase CoaBC [Gammaproteobacteria bacterium]|nr:bifunctional phosphopantothenoylcysteine decarboxylase/phosphopantothenate--cysteine ligase CoaBC [Gammaproteobacteria bacterium]